MDSLTFNTQPPDMLSRRELLSRAAYGLTSGVAAYACGLSVDLAVSALPSDRNTGNAGLNQQAKQRCQESLPTNADPAVCDSTPIQPTTADAATWIVRAPITEELVFRTAPSVAMDVVSPKNPHTQDNVYPILQLSRREIMVGVLSSLAFGAAHNLVARPVDYRTIPAFQTVAGFVFWRTQRVHGTISAMVAHAYVNSLGYMNAKLFAGRAGR